MEETYFPSVFFSILQTLWSWCPFTADTNLLFQRQQHYRYHCHRVRKCFLVLCWTFTIPV